MIITIDTAQPLSQLDSQVLRVLGALSTAPASEAAETAATPEAAPTPAKPVSKKAVPAKKVAVKKPAPAPEPEPEEEEVDIFGDADDDTESEYTQEDCVARAGELVADGKALLVKKTLQGLGVAKISGLGADQYGEFIAALADA